MQRRAIGTYSLVIALPVLFILPGVSEYPLTVIGGILVAMLGINMMPCDSLPEIPALPEKDRAKAAICPAGA